MTVAPSAAMIAFQIALSLFGVRILRKPWMRCVALGCAAVELACLVVLLRI